MDFRTWPLVLPLLEINLVIRNSCEDKRLNKLRKLAGNLLAYAVILEDAQAVPVNNYSLCLLAATRPFVKGRSTYM